MQTSLDKWFTGSKNKIAHIFYLDWDSNLPYPTKNAVWLDELSDIGRDCFTKNIMWRNFKMLVTICGKSVDAVDATDTNNKKKHPAIPILKSNLQKCIRRKLTTNAIKTAIAMINIDFMEFIRRLTIIMVEDCVVHESISTLVWMTAAYPEWKPNKNHINWLLGIVEYLSNLGEHDLVKRMDFDFKKNIETTNSLDSLNKSIVYSLYFRVSYGGMKGDMKMLEYFTKLWLFRLENRSNFNKYLYNTITPVYEDIVPIKKNEIEIEAADFHCYPQMISILHKKYNSYSLEEIKKSIWFHRSRITTKRLLNEHDDYDNRYKEIWKRIKNDVDIVSKKYLKMIDING